MTDPSDQELLGEYVRHASDRAFEHLVARHIDFVYSAALRMVIDPHLAKDVAQSVFVALARNARSLQRCSVLPGWLHRTARNQAAAVVRGEVRRRSREQLASTMNEQPLDDDEMWERLAPHLDSALAELSTQDRDALLLRYFQGKTAREIGEALGLREEAAQKRVARALERLRSVFCRRGIAVKTASLAGAVAVQAVHAAPAGLGASVSAASLAGAAVHGSISVLGILTIMNSTKMGFAAATLVTAGLVTTVVLQEQTNRRLRTELAAFSAAQTEPVTQAPANPGISAEELAQLRAEHLELLRLRSEVTDLRQQNRERAAAVQEAAATPTPSPSVAEAQSVPPDFISSDQWVDVGADTPDHAFQSFLAALKAGDPSEIGSKVVWEVAWKVSVSDEDKELVEKSMDDYLEMLQRAPRKITAFQLSPVSVGDDVERTRVFFRTLTADGSPVDSSFEMVRVDGQWKPVLSMRWVNPQDAHSTFATSQVFGPAIDLDP